MIEFKIKCSEYNLAFEMEDTIEVESKGCSSTIDLRKMSTEEIWKYFIDYAKRVVYDGASTVAEKYDNEAEKVKALEKRQTSMDNKVAMLHGERALASRGDAVASVMKDLAFTVLQSAPHNLKRKDIPKLGSSVDEVKKALKALKVKAAKIDKIVELAEAEVARKAETRKALAI